MRTSGVWYVSASGNTEEKHFPSGVSNGWLQIYAFNGEVKQLFYRFGTANVNDSQIFVRTFYTPSQSWSNWVRLITNTDLQAKALETSNLNDIKSPGVYFQSHSNNATTERNYPAEDAGFLEVMFATTGFVLQKYNTHSSGAVYKRTYNNSGWNGWKQV